MLDVNKALEELKADTKTRAYTADEMEIWQLGYATGYANCQTDADVTEWYRPKDFWEK